jgi:magnesium transporter
LKKKSSSVRRQKRRWSRRRSPPGSSPGAMVPEPGALPPRIRIAGYGPETLLETTVESPEGIRDHVGRFPVLWVHVDGLGHAATVESIGALFGFHRLALADAVNVPQRPKGEDYEDTFFLLLRAPRPPEVGGGPPLPPTSDDSFDLAQISFFVRDGLLVSFQSCPDELFEPVRARLRQEKTRIRSSGADYLAYALVDTVIDAYFPLLEGYGETLEAFENRVIAGEGTAIVATIHERKHDLSIVRRVLWPTREAILEFLRDDSPYLARATRLHLRDAVDHVNQLLDLVDAHVEFSSSLMVLHQSFLQQKSNEIMKVLTMLASIFIPLTFIVGIYGMNFDPDSSPWNMPELRWRWGYPAVLLLMLLVVGAMWIYFRRKGWIGHKRR